MDWSKWWSSFSTFWSQKSPWINVLIFVGVAVIMLLIVLAAVALGSM